MKKEIPVVIGIPEDGQIKIQCPYCKKAHYHGAVGGRGHRSAHCDKDKDGLGYIIEVKKMEKCPKCGQEYDPKVDGLETCPQCGIIGSTACCNTGGRNCTCVACECGETPEWEE